MEAENYVKETAFIVFDLKLPKSNATSEEKGLGPPKKRMRLKFGS